MWLKGSRSVAGLGLCCYFVFRLRDVGFGGQGLKVLGFMARRVL